ncbi:XTP/dITP diphosphatase [Thalassobacillus hwangdonensis]|uniref:dITP/XTP pyrophosphatase n=1 Tax=Thalassobacillus hwangdonensis TaxID=546108 RepID=A0ABW3L1H1_9BACI
MKELVIATKNAGKVKEFKEMLKDFGIEVKSLLDLDFEGDIVEDGLTFEENATIKAETIAEWKGIPVLADDSGLEIDALDGRPGVYSARYAGEEKDDVKNMEKVLEEMQQVPDEQRTARFVCSVAVARPGHPTFVERGTCEGSIGREPRGTNGFGYDPIFYPEGADRSMAEHDPSEKNAISHRRNAIKKVEEWLKNQNS